MDHQYATKQIERNNVFTNRINKIYSSLMVVVFMCQVVYLETNREHLENIAGILLMVSGILMFLIDIVIIARFFISINRIN